jgi:hypothetical protein
LLHFTFLDKRGEVRQRLQLGDIRNNRRVGHHSVDFRLQPSHYVTMARQLPEAIG